MLIGDGLDLQLKQSSKQIESINILFCAQQDIRKSWGSASFQTSPPCHPEWTLDSSLQSPRRTGRVIEALRSCGGSKFHSTVHERSAPHFFSFTHSSILRSVPRIRRSQSGNPTQAQDPEVGEFKRGGFRATAGPRLAQSGNSRYSLTHCWCSVCLYYVSFSSIKDLVPHFYFKIQKSDPFLWSNNITVYLDLIEWMKLNHRSTNMHWWSDEIHAW